MKTTEKQTLDKDGYILLPATFTSKGFNFKLEKKLKNNWFVYKRWKTGQKTTHFELIYAKKQEEFYLAGNLIPKKWAYPSDSEWGTNGFTLESLEKALQKYEKIC